MGTANDGTSRSTRATADALSAGADLLRLVATYRDQGAEAAVDEIVEVSEDDAVRMLTLAVVLLASMPESDVLKAVSHVG